MKPTNSNDTDEWHYVMVDEVEIMSRSDSHRAATTASYARVRLMQRLMYKDER